MYERCAGPHGRFVPWRVGALFLALGACVGGCRVCPGPVAPGLVRVDARTFRGPRHLADDIPTYAASGAVHAVVEIPAGTQAKFEVDHEAGTLVWETRDGRLRVIDFLGYPGNYGLVPRTAVPEADGGDGDPLDVLVLGPPARRGALLEVRAVAVLPLLDAGERDHKVIAVAASPEPGAPFAAVEDLEDLRRGYPAALEIIRLFFTGYDRADTLEAGAFEGREAAEAQIRAAAAAYRER